VSCTPTSRCRYESEDIYRHVPQPSWVGLADEIWTPHAGQEDPSLNRMRQLIKRARASKKPKLLAGGLSMPAPEENRKAFKRAATAKLHMGPSSKRIAPDEMPKPKASATRATPESRKMAGRLFSLRDPAAPPLAC